MPVILSAREKLNGLLEGWVCSLLGKDGISTAKGQSITGETGYISNGRAFQEELLTAKGNRPLCLEDLMDFSKAGMQRPL